VSWDLLFYVAAGFAAQLVDGALGMAYGVTASSLLLSLGVTPAVTHVRRLGFVGALADSLGGGGWGPIVASTHIARGHDVRQTVGSVNAAEFFVTLAASIAFVLMLGLTHWQMIAGLALGGLLAAPLGAWACARIPHRPFMVAVGLLVIVLSLRTLLR
jgi:uncharacterized membrane protein YfcA